jgi:hypothetical protein
MLGLLEHSPDLYLDEIQEQLLDQHDCDISLAAIWRTLKRLGIGSKKVSLRSTCMGLLKEEGLQLSKAASERCADARRTFSLEIGQEPVERLVCADESAVNILTSYRDNGWAFTGVRARKRTCFVRGTRCVLHN